MIRQIVLSLSGKPVEFQMEYDSEFQQYRNLFWYFEHKALPEPELLDVMGRVLRQGDICADIGACIGFFTLVMSQLVGSAGKVYAIEPDPRNCVRIKRNLELNKINNVELVQVAAWERNGLIGLHYMPDSGENYVDSASAVQVRAKRIDALCTNLDFIKIDAEGSELAALRGAPFAKVRCIVSELNEGALVQQGTSRFKLRKFMYSCGFETFFIEDGKFPVLIPDGVEIVCPCLNFNVMFSTLKRVAEVWPKFEV